MFWVCGYCFCLALCLFAFALTCMFGCCLVVAWFYYLVVDVCCLYGCGCRGWLLVGLVVGMLWLACVVGCYCLVSFPALCLCYWFNSLLCVLFALFEFVCLAGCLLLACVC